MMHIGAAEDNETNDGYEQVPIDSFDEEHQVYLRLYMDYYKKKGLDIGQIFIYIFELMCKEDLKRTDKIQYSKKFFSRYYFIDAETFNKWIEHFCPELYTEDFKKKRKFTNEEANLIFEKLGTVSNNEILPSTRKELISKLPDNIKWKKSKNYESIQAILDEYNTKYESLNKLPPVLVKKVLLEETLNQKYTLNERDLELEKSIQSTIMFMEYCFPNYTDWEWAIRKRWFRLLLSKE